MKKLQHILSGFSCSIVQGNSNAEVQDITFDSRKVKFGSLFVAIRGTLADGHKYLAKAAEQGASVIVCEEVPEPVNENATIVIVENTRKALAWISTQWYDNPASTMKIIGITGTNGKTTTATMLYNVFRELGYPCGLFSTVRILINGREEKATHTTPNPIAIQSIMAQMRDEGCEYCFMEVSSHAIDQNRVEYMDFAVGVFTNITQDHLDYHETFKNYIEAKQKFFTQLSPNAIAIFNVDDKNGKIMVQNAKARQVSYSVKKPSDFKTKIIKQEMDGMFMEIDDTEVWTRLTGLFNAYNMMAVYATASQFYSDKPELLTKISSQNPVCGRFEHVKSDSGVHAIIDYAHTPDAVENVLSTVTQVRNGNEQLIVLIGAGGNRDTTKRPLMATKACKFADIVIFTSDNPRNEDPKTIIAQMKEGIPLTFRGREFTIESREEAIKVACGLAQPGDIIVVAGKGHESYQEIKGVRHHFDDKEIVMKHIK